MLKRSDGQLLPISPKILTQNTSAGVYSKHSTK